MNEQPIPLRVLIIEDDPITAEAHAAYLERVSGYVSAGIAHTGHAAIRMLGNARQGSAPAIDLILLDMNLPDTTGIELCRALRAAGVDTDVIAVTAVRDAAVVRTAVALGIVQYLIKPFGFAAFAAKLTAFREYRALVSSGAVTDQRAVDATFAALRPTSVVDLPKGMNADTLELVLVALRRAHPRAVSAVELASDVDVARVTARRYLEFLVQTNAAERSSRYGTPGRPESEYRLRGSANVPTRTAPGATSN